MKNQLKLERALNRVLNEKGLLAPWRVDILFYPPGSDKEAATLFDAAIALYESGELND